MEPFEQLLQRFPWLESVCAPSLAKKPTNGDPARTHTGSFSRQGEVRKLEVQSKDKIPAMVRELASGASDFSRKDVVQVCYLTSDGQELAYSEWSMFGLPLFETFLAPAWRDRRHDWLEHVAFVVFSVNAGNKLFDVVIYEIEVAH